MSPADQPGGEPALEDARDFAGVPDDTQRLWTPHRMAYIGGENKPEDPHDDEQCPFCAGPRRSDEDALIVHRGRTAYVVLNLYPYNAGHLLVCPYRHVADYTDLDDAEADLLGDLEHPRDQRRDAVEPGRLQRRRSGARRRRTDE